MIGGLLAGVLWGLDTVILGIALLMSPFVSFEAAVIIAPLVSTFLHDAFSSLWMLLYMGVRGSLKGVWSALKSKSGKFIVLGALMGGPVGMSGYVAAIRLIGPAYTSVISALYPAIGALFAYVFLKEKMTKLQVAGLPVSVACVMGIGYAPESGAGGRTFVFGVLCALLCVIGWSLEAVICSYGMRDGSVNNEQALQIRQLTSAVFYGAVILPVISGWGFAVRALSSKAMLAVVLAAMFGTCSYLMYYRAIKKIGPSRAMALNITYSAWAIVFSTLLLRQLPDIKNILLGAILVCSSLVAAGCNVCKKKDY